MCNRQLTANEILNCTITNVGLSNQALIACYTLVCELVN